MEKNKHDHKATKTLKIIIFALFLLAPFFAILSTTAYASINANAKESITTETYTLNQKIELQNLDTFIENQTIYVEFNNTSGTYNTATYMIEFTNLSIDAPSNAHYITWGASIAHTDQFKISFYDANKGFINNINAPQKMQFIIKSTTNDNRPQYFTNNLFHATATQYELIEKQYNLDNAFYYATNQLEQQSVFNWTQETLIYNVISTTTSGLGINNNAINIIITYEFFIIVIYIIFDIVIEMFTFLTHAITKNN